MRGVWVRTVAEYLNYKLKFGFQNKKTAFLLCNIAQLQLSVGGGGHIQIIYISKNTVLGCLARSHPSTIQQLMQLIITQSHVFNHTPYGKGLFKLHNISNVIHILAVYAGL